MLLDLAALFDRRSKADRRSVVDRLSPCDRFSSSDRASTLLRRSRPVRLSKPARFSATAVALPLIYALIPAIRKEVVKDRDDDYWWRSSVLLSPLCSRRLSCSCNFLGFTILQSHGCFEEWGPSPPGHFPLFGLLPGRGWSVWLTKGTNDPRCRPSCLI